MTFFDGLCNAWANCTIRNRPSREPAYMYVYKPYLLFKLNGRRSYKHSSTLQQSVVFRQTTALEACLVHAAHAMCCVPTLLCTCNSAGSIVASEAATVLATLPTQHSSSTQQGNMPQCASRPACNRRASTSRTTCDQYSMQAPSGCVLCCTRSRPYVQTDREPCLRPGQDLCWVSGCRKCPLGGWTGRGCPKGNQEGLPLVHYCWLLAGSCSDAAAFHPC